MPKITFIGAGSFGFTRKLVRDLLSFKTLEASEIALMDINEERLDFAKRACERIVEAGGYPAKVTATSSRAEALEGADFVVVTILVGSTDVWRHDIEIPKKYGVDINVGDTRGVAGIFRAIRTVPVLVDIAKDMERYCPKALMLNYTNPMAMLCRAISKETSIQVTGLCHSVQGTAEMLAGWIGAPMDEITYTCAGINHTAWYIDYQWKGEDAYPLIHKAITEQQDVYNAEQVRNEMYLALDYYVTESSGHNSEYNWWFRKRPDLIEKYCTHGTNWNPGHHAYILKEYQRRAHDWRDDILKWFEEEVDLEPSHEYAAYIMNAMSGGAAFQFNGNVPNKNLISNLPYDACVEVPVWVSKKGLEPVAVGALPQSVLPLTNLYSQIEEMTVEAIQTGNRKLIYQAVAYSPLSAAVLSLAEIKDMVDELFAVNEAHLPAPFHA
ncbi:MAG: alpha-galactosidase [Trueperaceae bacterium]|nr:alpha-galactosidase [Trueperaceae bacterium]